VTRWFDAGEPIILWSFDDSQAVDCVVANESLWDGGIWCAAFSPDESCLAALAHAGSHSVFLLLDVPSLELIKRTELSSNPSQFSWHCDGRTLVLGGELESGVTESFDTDTGQLIKFPFDSTVSVCCHPNKSIAAFANNQRITVGDLSHGAILGQFDAESINHMCWNVDGTMLYAVSGSGHVYTYMSTS
jgi:WD40 repeat protein